MRRPNGRCFHGLHWFDPSVNQPVLSSYAVIPSGTQAVAPVCPFVVKPCSHGMRHPDNVFVFKKSGI